MSDTVAKLTIGDKTYEFPVLSGSVGPDVIDIRSLYAKTGLFTYDPGFTSTAACDSTITYIDGDKGELMYRGYPIEQLADEIQLPRSLLSAALRRTAEQPRRCEDFDQRVTRHTMVHEQMHLFYPRLPPRRASDGGGVRRGRRHGGVLPRLDRHHRSRAARDRLDPHDRQDADDRRHGLQILGRPALRVSAQRPRLRQQFPAHVLLGAGRGIRGQPGHRPRDGPDLHAPCRPRAERLDLDRAPRRLVRRQPVRLHRGRRCLPVGPGPWRRQRSGAQHAQGDRHARPHPRIHRQGQGQEFAASA